METRDHAAYYHVCTDGNALQWMFQDKEDFIAGINRIAICVAELKILVLAYVLMDNHVHFVLWGTLVQCKDFITKYKLLTGRWVSKKYGKMSPVKHLPTQFILISGEEQLLDTIAYIDRNAIVAGYRYLPCEYPWGSARFMFRDKVSPTCGTTKLSDLSETEKQDILKTWAELPGDWEIDQNGMILPECFLDISKLEGLFKSPARYLYYLSKKLEGKVEIQHGIQAFICDKELRVIVKDLCLDLFGRQDSDNLDFNSKLLLARRLRYNYASTPKQISRMLNMNVDILTKFI